MKDKRWAKISAFVGILGGPLAIFSYLRYLRLDLAPVVMEQCCPLHY